jgi:hypothetical protein
MLSEQIIGYEYNLELWAILIVKVVRYGTCFRTLSMALILAVFSERRSKNPSSINYANEVIMIFAEDNDWV